MATTGRRAAMASSTARPQPSLTDGMARAQELASSRDPLTEEVQVCGPVTPGSPLAFLGCPIRQFGPVVEPVEEEPLLKCAC